MIIFENVIIGLNNRGQLSFIDKQGNRYVVEFLDTSQDGVLKEGDTATLRGLLRIQAWQNVLLVTEVL